MAEANSKVLSAGKIKSLLGSNKHVNRNDVEPKRWPGDKNMLRLAKAVDAESPFVVFVNGSRFSIKYNHEKKNVLIKPSTGGFAPMGYFSFKQLDEAKASDKVAANA